MGWSCGQDGRNEECIQNFDAKISWKTSTRKTKKEMDDLHYRHVQECRLIQCSFRITFQTTVTINRMQGTIIT